MDPREQVCHNPACWAWGRAGGGHVVIDSRRERRYECARCGKTFAATTGTVLYRAHKATGVVVQVVTLLAYGCPPQAIVAACGWDERTGRAISGRRGAVPACA
jgi:transposase-like protein